MEGITGTGTVTGTGTRRERDGRVGRNGIRNGEMEGPEQAGRVAEEKDKRCKLLGDVQEHWGVYAWEGADMIWDLQYS